MRTFFCSHPHRTVADFTSGRYRRVARKPGKPRKAKPTASRAPKAKPRAPIVATLKPVAPALDDEPAVEVKEFHPIDSEAPEGADAAEDLAAAEPIEPAGPIEIDDGDHPAAEAEPDADSDESTAVTEGGALVTVDPLGRYLAESAASRC